MILTDNFTVSRSFCFNWFRKAWRIVGEKIKLCRPLLHHPHASLRRLFNVKVGKRKCPSCCKFKILTDCDNPMSGTPPYVKKNLIPSPLRSILFVQPFIYSSHTVEFCLCCQTILKKLCFFCQLSCWPLGYFLDTARHVSTLPIQILQPLNSLTCHSSSFCAKHLNVIAATCASSRNFRQPEWNAVGGSPMCRKF